MKRKLIEDSIGSLLYKFFTEAVQTFEDEDTLVSTLTRMVEVYRTTQSCNLAIIVCPKYNETYTKMVPGISVTAQRAINLFRRLKKRLRRHISYGTKTNCTMFLFDQENRGKNMTECSTEEMDGVALESLAMLKHVLRKDPRLPDAFKADVLVGSSRLSLWRELHSEATTYIERNMHKEADGFSHPDVVFNSLSHHYKRIAAAHDNGVHRDMFTKDDAPSYLSGGRMVRRLLGPDTLIVDIGSPESLAKMTLWQPETDCKPLLLRIKNPRELD
jgi:hypothetical protein